jgi:serine/threonine protein kinase
MKEHFKHSGPNGEHGCLVFDPMGRSVANVLENLSKPLRPKNWLPAGMSDLDGQADTSTSSSLLGLDFLHQIGIAHGDLQEGNLLFSAKHLTSVGEETLSQPLPPIGNEREEIDC